MNGSQVKFKSSIAALTVQPICICLEVLKPFVVGSFYLIFDFACKYIKNLFSVENLCNAN